MIQSWLYRDYIQQKLRSILERVKMKMVSLEKRFVNSEGHSLNVSRHAEKLLRFVPVTPKQRLLDVGTGNGAVPIHLSQTFGLDATGVDVDPEQIALAQARSSDSERVHFMTVDGIKLPFEDGEFDVVFSNKVTHHIPNWQDVVLEMIRVLKPGGYLVYSDLVYPQVLAGVGQALAGRWAGFPTRKTFHSLTAQHQLSSIYQSGTLLQFEGVFRKPAGRSADT